MKLMHDASLLMLLMTILLFSPSSANESNILMTGDTLPTEGRLSSNGVSLVMQNDCNLVLYNKNKGFQSNTHNLGTNCTLTLSNHGQLLLRTSNRYKRTVWCSYGGTKKGKYVAVLGPDGQVKVFGPSIWSTLSQPLSTVEVAVTEKPEMGRNLMFTNGVLGTKGRLESGEYSLVMTEDCNLELTKNGSEGVVWESMTKREGWKNCSLMLDNIGRLTIKNQTNFVWKTASAEEKGDYVLVLQANGEAVVYGPVIWSTAGRNI